MIVLQGDCWYVHLGHMLGNSLEPLVSSITECMNLCPKYCNEIKDFLMLVKKSGLSVFFADNCINNRSGEITPDLLVHKLIGYSDVGRLIYNRPRINKTPALKFINVTVLQLIASELISLDFYNEGKCLCRLNMTDLRPTYLDDSICEQISMVDESD